MTTEEIEVRHQKILKFIKGFSAYGDDVISCFLTGNCYYFAQSLSHRFSEREFGKVGIYYNVIENHFAYYDCVTEKLYDISGEISDTGFIAWNTYYDKDSTHYTRIYNQCILKEE